jgi:hypothetical protein
LWLRGRFPGNFLSKNDEASLRWRLNFINTYLERDVPQLGPRIPAVSLRNRWTILAHSEGGQVNIAQLGNNLDVAAPTAKRYIELLEDLLLIRTLRPWSGNVGKRLVKAPKVYIRDSGITHALLNLTTLSQVSSDNQHKFCHGSDFLSLSLKAAMKLGIRGKERETGHEIGRYGLIAGFFLRQ